MRQYYIGIDGGATNIKGGIVNDKAKIVKFLTSKTKNKNREKAVIENVINLVNNLIDSKYKIEKIGLAWPNNINVALTRRELKKILSKKYKLKVHDANDAALFAFGESQIGQAKNKKIVLGITLGTGVGSGLIRKNIIYNPEFGHVPIKNNGIKCKCGKKGCFEEYAGSRALIRLIKKYDLNAKNGQELYKLALAKNKKALLLWQEYGRQLAWGLIPAIKKYNPAIIVLGGGISGAYKFFAKSMKNEIKNNNIIIKKSTLKNAAVVGAALYAKNKK